MPRISVFRAVEGEKGHIQAVIPSEDLEHYKVIGFCESVDKIGDVPTQVAGSELLIAENESLKSANSELESQVKKLQADLKKAKAASSKAVADGDDTN
ncbi:hypothetical protein KW500_18580 [Vibrio fluvialis]|nr:hypothetical protein [Vibrio fluvialis]